MATLFSRINGIAYMTEPTFAMSDVAYDLLLGDNSMPAAADGTLPLAISVPAWKMAILLKSLGSIGEDDIPARFMPYVNAYHDIFVQSEQENLLGVLFLDKELIYSLKKDYQYAIQTGMDVIQYRVS